ncbi:hypothetical protein ABT348_24140 [Streptomyces olivaceus]|uniref:hypothetical protein n=1 Tax=Streptomyces olivaceus TaxID=47716 RepID=UPI00331D7113
METAERLVRDLEASDDPAKRRLLPEARKVLRLLRDPSKAKRRVPASEEVCRHRAQRIRRAVQELDVEMDNDRSGS